MHLHKIGNCKRIPLNIRVAMSLRYNLPMVCSSSAVEWAVAMRNFIHHSKWARVNNGILPLMAHENKKNASSISLLQLHFNYFVKYGLWFGMACTIQLRFSQCSRSVHRSNSIWANMHFHSSHANATLWFIFISLDLHFIDRNTWNLMMAASFFCFFFCKIRNRLRLISPS